jgi:hypothetical protein
MGATNPQVRITRRGFLECGSAVASAGLVGNGYAESVLRGGIVLDSVKPSSEPLAGKIALEEHFVLAQTIESSYAVRDLHPETRQKILDLDSGRKGVRDRVLALWWRTIPRRSQKRRISWTHILVWLSAGFLYPRALHPFPDARFAASHLR